MPLHLKTIRTPSTKATPNPLYRVVAYPNYRLSPSFQGFLADKYCVRHEITKEALDQKPRQGLWWSVTGNHMQVKSVMRSWCKKRMKKAILEALRKEGFDECGMPLAVKEGGGTLYPPRTRGPEGTLMVFCQEPLLTASAEEVRVAGELVVRQALQRVGLRWGG